MIETQSARQQARPLYISPHRKPFVGSAVFGKEDAAPGFGRVVVRALILVALIVVPVIGHGCHGEDVDDELFARTAAVSDCGAVR